MGMISKIEDEKGTREMKKYLMMVALMPLMAVCGEWKYAVDGGKVTVGTYYGIGNLSWQDKARPLEMEWYSGELIIPPVLDGYPVVCIGRGAFNSYVYLSKVVISSGVTEIKEGAFENCVELKSVSIPPSVKIIRKGAFQDAADGISVEITDLTKWCGIAFGSWDANPLCRGGRLFLNGEEVVDLKIPEGVTEIKNFAFYGCCGLRSVTIPNSVTKIGHEAFKGCDSLMNITIPESVTAIGYDALDCAAYWTSHYKRELNGGSGSTPSTGGGVTGGGSTGYALSTSSVGDSTITSMTVTGDTAIGSFLLADGKVFDMAIRLVNAANAPVRLSLPSGYTYEKIGVADPLTFPANSTNMVTITRTADKVFLVSRQELRPVQ